MIAAALCIVAELAGVYAIFEKAGIPGWKCLIPVYSAVLLLRIVDRPGWWLVLLLVPGVNIVVGVLVQLQIGERFGRGIGFGVGLVLLPFLFYPVLGFGDSSYTPEWDRD